MNLTLIDSDGSETHIPNDQVEKEFVDKVKMQNSWPEVIVKAGKFYGLVNWDGITAVYQVTSGYLFQS